MLVIAHLSDTHFGGHDTAVDRSARVLEHLAGIRPGPDVVLVTGDIADHGTAEEYAEAEQTLGRWPGPAPMLFCPGNHDVRETYAAFRRRPGDGPVNEAHQVAGHLFLMLDSLVPAPPGERFDHGYLENETLAWLDQRLAAREPGERAFICLHHPPIDIHVSLMDPIKLANADQLAVVLERHEDVVAVLVGHAHTACASTFAGLPVVVGGGLASTVTLDAEPLPMVTHELGPSFAVHLVGDDGRLVTHWRTL